MNCGNKTHGSTGSPAIRCGWGSVLVIDDSVRNLDTSNNIVMPVNGKVGADVTLIGGKKLKAGDPLHAMDAENPGTLYAQGGSHSAGIGSGPQENAGTLIFNGGNLIVAASNVAENGSGDNSASSGAGIGSGDGGSGTLIMINGGNIDAQASYHGAGIGCGWGWKHWYNLAKADAIAIPRSSYSVDGYSYYNGSHYYNVAGDIYINGGFIRAKGASHGNAFGMGCGGSKSTNTGHIIKVTGGTLLPSSAGDRYDIGGKGGYTIVTGGSVNCVASKFQGVGGTAYNTASVNTWDDVVKMGGSLPDKDKVHMIKIDLTSEINPDKNPNLGDNLIESWDPLVANLSYHYGAPRQFDKGILYLWLPNSATEETVTVNLAYRDNNGKIQTIEPLFREPGSGTILKRYVEFELPKEYTDRLSKPYDGTPFDSYDVEIPGHEIITEEEPPKKLNLNEPVTYIYQKYDKREGEPIGPEVNSGKEMPSDEGVMRFTMTSTQYSNDDTGGFMQNYWGHRAFGWCEITPVPSRVALIKAAWVEDSQNGDVHHPSSKELDLTAEISSGYFDNDPKKPTAGTCKAPEGKVQLYVDGKPVGEPVEILFEDKKDEDGKVIAPKNATRVDNGKGGSFTRFSFAFVPSDADHLVPDATTDGKHIVSLQYLPSKNYLKSVNPADDPEAAPKAEVAIEPIDPKPVPSIGDPKPNDPDRPEKPGTEPEINNKTPETDDNGEKIIRGTVTLTYFGHEEGKDNPGRVEVKIKTPSSGAFTVQKPNGEIIQAEMKRDKDGNPVRNPDGTYSLFIDPTDVGTTTLLFKQAPNGAYTGTNFEYAVNVLPDPQLKPKPRIEKKAENLTHPNGPTQPGDRLRYTITAANDEKGSTWNNVVIEDPLPSCLELLEDTVSLKNAKEPFDGALTKVADAAPSLGQFTFTAKGTDDAAVETLQAPAGNLPGGCAATLVFECVVRDGSIGRDIPGAPLANIASAQGTRLDPANPLHNPELPVDPVHTKAAVPAGGDRVVPRDPQLEMTKIVVNATDPTADRTREGDTLRYTITLENTGHEESCAIGTTITDPLPRGLELIEGSLKLTRADGTEVAVSDSAFHKDSHTIAVTSGDLWGSDKVVLSFACKVTAEAVGSNLANIAYTYGSIPSQGPESTPKGEEPGKPATPPGKPDKPLKSTPPTSPPTLVGNDPQPGDITLEKEADNLTRDDGRTAVGDTVRYTITFKNEKVGTAWMNAVLKDEIPKGLEPLTKTLKLTLPDGTVKDVPDEAYNPDTRLMALEVGHLYGGQTIVLVFDALVTEDAVGADIGNIAVGKGTPPSKWDLDDDDPEPGKPTPQPDTDPDDDPHSVKSNPSYPPGTNEKGGVMPLEQETVDPANKDNKPSPAKKKAVDDSRTIAKTRLAQTGDTAYLVAGLCLITLFIASAGAVSARRRRR